MKNKMIKGKTSSGFAYAIDERRLNNYELVEAISKVEDNPVYLVSIVDLLLGEEAQKLKDYIRDEDGFVDNTMLFKEIEEIMNGSGGIKNS